MKPPSRTSSYKSCKLYVKILKIFKWLLKLFKTSFDFCIKSNATTYNRNLLKVAEKKKKSLAPIQKYTTYMVFTFCPYDTSKMLLTMMINPALYALYLISVVVFWEEGGYDPHHPLTLLPLLGISCTINGIGLEHWLLDRDKTFGKTFSHSS